MASGDDLDTSVEPDDRLVKVFATASNPEGMLAKGLLESAGIPVSAKGESEGPLALGQVFLWVPQAYEDEARALLADARSGANEREADEEAERAAGDSTPA